MIAALVAVVVVAVQLAGDDDGGEAAGPSSSSTSEPEASSSTTATTEATTTTAPPTTAAPTTAAPPPPTTAAPAPPSSTGLRVDESKIPAPAGGVSVARLTTADKAKSRKDGIGAFRTNCRMSHMNFDDPIVFPGRTRATHLHIFYGNTTANARSTPDSIRTSGASTCSGGTLNRSGYWAPAVIDTRTHAPVLPGPSGNDKDYALQIYYKTGYDGIRPESVRNFPAGLRIVAGNSRSTGPQPGIVEYSCTASDGSRSQVGTRFPSCRGGELFIMAVEFPQCWDGKNLDSPDHKSHMAYGLGWHFKGCPASHPVPLPQITQHFRYRVPSGGMSTWRLSSDMYDGPAGYSGHADWMNGWHAATFERIVANCFRGGYDCETDLLGDGQALTR